MSHAQFAILGAGAIGSILGAHLARAGHSVAMLVRERRARQIDADGLRIKGLVDFSTPVRTITRPQELRSADVLVVTTKAIDTAAALEPLRGADIGVAFSLQNGVMKNEILAAAFDRTYILGAQANFSGEMLPSGVVSFTRNINLMLGDLDGTVTPRAEAIARTIEASGVRSTAVPNIRSQEWSKFAAWVGLAAVAVTTRLTTWKYLEDPGAALVLVRVIREVGTLASTCGVQLNDEAMFPVASMCKSPESTAVEVVTAIGAEFHKNSPTHRLSTLQDLEAGRPLELDETMGYAVRLAEQHDLKLPLLEAGYLLARSIDRNR
jgi:2-dehydropantoate 2-reductase